MRLAGLFIALICFPLAAQAAGSRGDFVQTDTLGMGFVTHRFDTGTTSTFVDAPVLSEFVGLHYYFMDRVRIGMNFQYSEQLTTPTEGASRFTNFSLLPQIGWDFYGPFFVALVNTISLRAYSKNDLELGFQAVAGAGLPLTSRLKATLAFEVPFNLMQRQSIGLTALVGVSVRMFP